MTTEHASPTYRLSTAVGAALELQAKTTEILDLARALQTARERFNLKIDPAPIKTANDLLDETIDRLNTAHQALAVCLQRE